MTSSLSHSTAHYLMALRDLLSERGYARGVDIAEYIGVSRPAAYQALQALKRRGWVHEDERHFYSLVGDAETLASRLSDNLEMLKRFFHDILGLDPEAADHNACDIEHHLSEDASHRFLAFLAFLETDPSGEELVRRFQSELRAIDAHRESSIVEDDETVEA